MIATVPANTETSTFIHQLLVCGAVDFRYSPANRNTKGLFVPSPNLSKFYLGSVLSQVLDYLQLNPAGMIPASQAQNFPALPIIRIYDEMTLNDQILNFPCYVSRPDSRSGRRRRSPRWPDGEGVYIPSEVHVVHH